MEISLINLQNSVKYLSNLPRRIASRLPVERIGFIHNKTERIDRYFILPSVILVLNGTGVLEQNGERIPLRGPFMLWNWSGEYKRYWPESCWDELYIGFNPGAEKELRTCYDPEFFQDTPHAIRYLESCMRYINDVLLLLPHAAAPGTADRIDSLARMILLEAVYPHQEEFLSPVESGLVKIAEFFQTHYRQDINLAELAAQFGMSYSTFQRAWRRKYPDCTPNQYLRNLRNTAALDYLNGTNLSMGDIAAALGFNNPFYFSRFFRDMNGVTPSEYRKNLPRNSASGIRPGGLPD